MCNHMYIHTYVRTYVCTYMATELEVCVYITCIYVSTCIVMSLLLCRVESERAQVLSMLNSSLRAKEQAQHQTACDSDLLKEIRSLREEVSGEMDVRMYVGTWHMCLARTYGMWFVVVCACVRTFMCVHTYVNHIIITAASAKHRFCLPKR